MRFGSSSRAARGVGVALIAAMALAACGSSGSSKNATQTTAAGTTGASTAGTTGASTSATTATPKTGGTITIIKPGNEQSAGWDPLYLVGIPNNGETPQALAIYDVLFYEDPTSLALQPRLGLSLTSPDGGTTWTLKLRPNVKFSDGTPFDAAAVQFNWQRIADPANKARNAVSAQEIRAMSAPDPQTLTITLKAADPLFDHRVAEKLAWIGSPTAIQSEGANFTSQPVGAGPFILKSWTPNTQYTFEKNPTYWEQGHPYLDGFSIKMIADEESGYNTLKAGQADATLFSDPSIIAEAKKDGLNVTQMSATGGGWAIAMNTSKAPFTDPRVRNAIDLAIDRKQFNDSRRGGDQSFMVQTLDKAGSPYYDATIKPPATDLAAAQKLIDQVVADTGGPVEFTLDVFNTPYIAQDGQLLQAQLSQLKNVHVTLNVGASATIVQRYSTGNFQATLAGPRWNEPGIDMVTWFSSASNQNWMKYSSPTVDSALQKLVSATDEPTRVTQAHVIEQQVLKDSPVAWYAGFASGTEFAKRVQGYNSYFDQVPLMDSVWVSDGKS